jgi:hypothetical protein
MTAWMVLTVFVDLEIAPAGGGERYAPPPSRCASRARPLPLFIGQQNGANDRRRARVSVR